MKESLEVSKGVLRRRLRDYALEILPLLRVTVTSMEVDGDHRVSVRGKNEENSSIRDVYVEILQQHRKVGPHVLTSFSQDAERQGLVDKIFVSTSGFTQEARDYALSNGIILRTPRDFDSMQTGVDVKPRVSHNIFERVYADSWDMGQAQEHFSKRRKRSFLLFFGSDERVESVEGRHAPVARFVLARADGMSADSASQDGISNIFHVNLNTCELYYIHLGVSGDSPSLRSSNVLMRLLGLPFPAVELFSWLVERKQVKFENLTQQEHNYMSKNVDLVSILLRRNLISPMQDHRGMMVGYFSNVNVPSFADKRYDLDIFAEVKESVESEYAPDEIEYNPSDVLNILTTLFRSNGQFNGVTYLSYYICKYMDSNGLIRFGQENSVRLHNQHTAP